MKPADLLQLLCDVYTDRVSLLAYHVAAARSIPQYEFNNAYQNVVARDETHLGWLRAAIEEMGGTLSFSTVRPEPLRASPGGDAVHAILADDVRRAQAFVERWQARVEAVTHARHRKMLDVIICETLEHKRFFEQALQGRIDLLGGRPAASVGAVLSERWVE